MVHPYYVSVLAFRVRVAVVFHTYLFYSSVFCILATIRGSVVVLSIDLSTTLENQRLQSG